MSLKDNSGNVLSQTGLQGKTSQKTYTADRVLNENVYEFYDQPGTSGQRYKRLKYRAGQVVTQAEFDALYSTLATLDTVSPATGGTAGGTSVTVTGSGLYGATQISFGGTYATNLKVVNDSKLTCTVPAHAAGAVNVVLTDDSGQVTKTNGFVYA